jgi:molybdopterin/thiamine biosynthesis adenylyltransferase
VNKTIVVVGVGGIGSHLLPPLMRYFAALNKESRPAEIRIVDGDSYEEGNSNRQEFASFQVGENKADAQVERYKTLYPGMMDCISFPTYLGTENVADIIPENAVVFLGVDNHVCRHVVSVHAQALENVILITGANELVDGNVQIFARAGGEGLFPPIEERHPEIATDQDGDRSQMSCEEIEQLPSGGQIIFTNLTAANLMLQLYWRTEVEDLTDTQEVYFDIKAAKTRSVPNG